VPTDRAERVRRRSSLSPLIGGARATPINGERDAAPQPGAIGGWPKAKRALASGPPITNVIHTNYETFRLFNIALSVLFV
jgi:hypothetical protein